MSKYVQSLYEISNEILLQWQLAELIAYESV